MKKLVATILGLSLWIMNFTSVFAEFTIDDFINSALVKNSFANTMDLSRVTQISDGQYYAIDTDVEDESSQRFPFDIEKTVRKYTFMFEQKSDIENYDGTGLASCYVDFFYDYKMSHYSFFTQFDDGNWYYLLPCTDDMTTLKGDSANEYVSEIEAALAVFNESRAAVLNDTYSFKWVERVHYSSGSSASSRTFGCSGVYFNTDKGEYVVTYNVTSRLVDKWEEYKLYTIDEFLEIAASIYSEAAPIVRENFVTVDENGEDVIEDIIETPIEEVTEEKDIVEEEPADKEKEPVEDKAVEDEKSEEVPVEEVHKDKFVKTDMNKIDVILNGKPLEFVDQEPVIVNDRVLVPLRVIFEEIGADVSWNGEKQEVTMKKDGVTVSLIIGAAELIKNGEKAELDAAAEIRNERTLVPIRAITESFGNTVTWDGNNKIVEIK